MLCLPSAAPASIKLLNWVEADSPALASLMPPLSSQALPQHPRAIGQHHGADSGNEDGGGGEDGGVNTAPRIAENHLRQGGHARA